MTSSTIGADAGMQHHGGFGGTTAVTVRADDGGIVIRVEGPLDDVTGRAILDAVRVAVLAGDSVTIEHRSADEVTSGAVRDLSVCAHLGAELHFVGHGAACS
jgi:hypothetical protein